MKCICIICGKEFEFGEGCFETDDGDLCPTCTAEMRAEEDQEAIYQEQGLA